MTEVDKLNIIANMFNHGTDVQMRFHLPTHGKKLIFLTLASYFSITYQNKRFSKKIDFIPGFQLAFCDALPNNNRIFNPTPRRFLEKRPPSFHPNILPICALQAGADESLASWATKCTLDFQLLDMTPKNLTILIALLHLLGITSVSLSSLGRKRGSTSCFLTAFPNIPLNSVPTLIRDADQILISIEEFRRSKYPLKSLDPSIADAKEHILPRLRQQIETDIENNVVLQLYQDIINASDTDLRNFCEQFLGKEFQPSQQWMFEQLKRAQKLCQENINTEIKGRIPEPAEEYRSRR